MIFDDWLEDNEDELYIMYNETGAVYDMDYEAFLEWQFNNVTDETVTINKDDINLLIETIMNTTSITMVKEKAKQIYSIINGEDYENTQ